MGSIPTSPANIMKEINDIQFREYVLNHRYYALIAFVADWHDKTEMVKERLKNIIPKNDKLLTIGWVDVTKFPSLVEGTNLKTLPHFVLYREGKVMSEFETLYSPWDLSVYLGEDLFKLLIKV